MKAEPTYANIYLRFREERFGTIPLPGLEIEHDDRVKVYTNLDAAFRHIRKLHDNNLKGIPE